MDDIECKWSTKTPLYIEKTDDRYEKHLKQLKERGFSDSETWGLSHVIVDFTLPRLIRFKELNNGYPMGMSSEEWDAILDEMIFAFKWVQIEEKITPEYSNMTDIEKKKAWKRYEKGMNLFAKYLLDLWW